MAHHNNRTSPCPCGARSGTVRARFQHLTIHAMHALPCAPKSSDVVREPPRRALANITCRRLLASIERLSVRRLEMDHRVDASRGGGDGDEALARPSEAREQLRLRSSHLVVLLRSLLVVVAKQMEDTVHH